MFNFSGTGGTVNSGTDSNSIGSRSARSKEESELAELLLQLQDEFGQLSL